MSPTDPVPDDSVPDDSVPEDPAPHDPVDERPEDSPADPTEDPVPEDPVDERPEDSPADDPETEGADATREDQAADSEAERPDAEPADAASGQEAGDAPAAAAGGSGLRGRLGRIGAVPLLAALLVALLVVGGYAWWQVRDLAGDSTADNLAHVDPDATARIEAELTRALEVLFSYDHERPDLAEANAVELLRGDARQEWDTLYSAFEEQAVGQDLTLSATVRRVGVRELSDDTASVVVFMDQTSARAGDDSASLAAAQLGIEAEHLDGAWRITAIDLL